MALIVKIILSVIFGYAGVVKIADPAGMREAIEAYRVIDGVLALAAAYFIPVLEVLLAVGLWLRPLAGASALILSGLSGFFTILILSALARGLDIECGCFGKALQAGSYTEVIIRDLALLILSLYLFFTLHTPKNAAKI